MARIAVSARAAGASVPVTEPVTVGAAADAAGTAISTPAIVATAIVTATRRPPGRFGAIIAP